MAEDPQTNDRRAIEEIIARQFGSLRWKAGKEGDWATFVADFFPGALLFPAARPAKSQSVPAFVERMQGLAKSTLHTFEERVLGSHVRIFGNVAIAMAGCSITENGTKESRGVEALLLIKDEATWRIIAQAWDMESDKQAIPNDLLSND